MGKIQRKVDGMKNKRISKIAQKALREMNLEEEVQDVRKKVQIKKG